MEIFIRIAIAKFYKSKLCLLIFIAKVVDTIEQAVIKLFEEHALPLFKKHNAQIWRNEKLWNEKCDIAIRANLSILKEIY